MITAKISKDRPVPPYGIEGEPGKHFFVMLIGELYMYGTATPDECDLLANSFLTPALFQEEAT